MISNIIKWIGTWDWGNVADWFAAIGTICAVFASVWITRYQVLEDRKTVKNNFFNEQEFKMLDDVDNNIADMQSVLLISLGDVKESSGLVYNTYEEMDSLAKKLKENQRKIDKNYLYISGRLYDYARTQKEYTSINMTELKNLLIAYGEVKSEINKLNSLLENIDKLEIEFNNLSGAIEALREALFKRKSDLRKPSA